MTIVPAVGLLGLAFGLSEFLLNVFKRSKRRDAGADAGSLRLIWIVILISMFIGMLVANSVPGAALPNGRGLYVAGFTIFGIGALLRWYSIFYLGRFFTVDVRVGEDHQVIDTGPYRWVRHPSYTGVLLEFIGFALCVGNALSMVVILVPTFCAFLYRIRVEELALRNGLGERYNAYCRRTRRLIPFVY